MRWLEHVAWTEMRSAYSIFDWKAWRKEALGRPRCRREDNIWM